ncbi:hypothetical protein A9K71_08150 [Mesorhizobium sp. WSM3873]|nr:hypothetical protein A9K71_08150 [Mesorhizobium sp. WSM3873]
MLAAALESVAVALPQRLTTPQNQRELSTKRASSQIQHVVRLMVKKSTYSREQNLNQSESVIRRRFVPDSFQRLIGRGF